MKNHFLIIHGLKDTLINVEQAISLYQTSNQKLRKIHFSKSMTHNEFDIQLDIIEPIKQLYQKIKQKETQKENK